jgi:hypothetical protein
VQSGRWYWRSGKTCYCWLSLPWGTRQHIHQKGLHQHIRLHFVVSQNASIWIFTVMETPNPKHLIYVVVLGRDILKIISLLFLTKRTFNFRSHHDTYHGELHRFLPSIVRKSPAVHGYRVSLPGVKQAGRGVNHPPPYSAEFKTSLAIPLLPFWAIIACSRVNITSLPFMSPAGLRNRTVSKCCFTASELASHLHQIFTAKRESSSLELQAVSLRIFSQFLHWSWFALYFSSAANSLNNCVWVDLTHRSKSVSSKSVGPNILCKLTVL